MNLFQALAAPALSRIAASQEVRKMSPSQPLGGMSLGGERPISTDRLDPTQAVLKGYHASVWVFACVFRLATAASSMPWGVERRTGDGARDWEPDTSHPYSKLLAFPNSSLSIKEVMFWTFAWLALNGNGLLKKVLGGTGGRQALELWPYSPRAVKPVPGNKQNGLFIAHYESREDGQLIRIPAEEIVHARLPDPLDPLWGSGMLRPAWASVQADSSGAAWRQKIFEDGGVPPGAIVDTNIVSDGQLQEALPLLQAAWRRASQNQGPMLLTKGTEWISFSFSASDLQFLEGRQFTVTEIVTAFGMLPAMFDSSAATYENLRTAVRFMYENGVIPLCDIVSDALTLSLLTEDERKRGDIRITYDTTQVPFFRSERAEKIASLPTLLQNGVSRDDAVQLLDLGLDALGPALGGETAFVSSSLVPLTEAAEGVASREAAGGTTPIPQPNPNADGSQETPEDDTDTTQ